MIADFGEARITDKLITCRGTAEYMSYQLLLTYSQGKKYACATDKIDVWSMGCIIS